MLADILMWNKIGRIIILLAKRLKISNEQAIDVFYTSETNKRLHDANDYLHMMSDRYVVDELIFDLQGLI